MRRTLNPPVRCLLGGVVDWWISPRQKGLRVRLSSVFVGVESAKTEAGSP